MKKATYQLKSREEKELEVQDLMDSMYKKMEGYTTNVDQVKEYLNFMSNFYKYSSRNQQLIQTQYPGAQGVGSFAFFKEKGFSVRKGEKGIKIFVPMRMKMFDRNGLFLILLRQMQKLVIIQVFFQTESKNSRSRTTI
ncbi:TPA: hypothetical protein LWG64_002741 [Listeria innocua]|nr:hypothetical protein [Listeria innocua]HBM4254395.1 hypothetical protein [Listeria innocua]